MERIQKLAAVNNINLVYRPVNSTADVKLVTASLLNKNIDVFFAKPDNIVFASFETIIKSCNEKNIPVFTSEAGLVERGALAAFGADIYQWGYQAGEQAALPGAVGPEEPGDAGVEHEAGVSHGPAGTVGPVEMRDHDRGRGGPVRPPRRLDERRRSAHRNVRLVMGHGQRGLPPRL